MSEEEKKAIKLLEDIKNSSWSTKYIMSRDSKNAEIILNLIQSQQKEIESLKQAGEATETVYKMQLEKKDKIIDIMAEFIDENIDDCLLNILNIDEPCENYIGKNKKLCKYCIKQYFKIKVEGK